MPKGFYLFLCKHAMGFFILPARQSCLQVLSTNPPPPAAQSLLWGHRAAWEQRGSTKAPESPPASGKCRARNCFVPKQQAKTHWLFIGFISRVENTNRLFCLEVQEQVIQNLMVPNVQGWGWRRFKHVNQPGRRLFLLIVCALPLTLMVTQLLHW